MSKIEQAKALWAEIPGRCPLCGADLVPGEGGLRCDHGHSFDFARQGSVYLLGGRVADKTYDAALFASRRKMLELGLFGDALDFAGELLASRSGLVLDAGCGEGYATHRLMAAAPGPWVGLDIAPAGIRMAAASYPGAAWLVGDLANIPLRDHGVDTLVNLLTPAHFGEFARVLKPGGWLVKAVPMSGHLRELRALAGLEAAQDSLAREGMAEHCHILGEKRITQTLPVPGELWADAVRMAPFAAPRREEMAAKLCELASLEVTSDLLWIWGTVKEDKHE